MSEHEKDTIVATVEKRGRKFIFWFGVARTCIVLGGVFLMLERKTEAVFEAPARIAVVERKDDSVFTRHDSIHARHNGYFGTIFTYVDTTKKKVR